MALILLLRLALALNPQQEYLFRQLAGPYSGVNSFVSLHDVPIANEVAYTSADRLHVYIDFRKLMNAPRTTYNVIRHELAHTRGAEHGDGTREMAYTTTVNSGGMVVDDTFLL